MEGDRSGIESRSLDGMKWLTGTLRDELRSFPLVPSASLSKRFGFDVLLKIEVFQPSGSFKIRGAMASLLALDNERRRAGVVAFSGGNFGLAVAEAACRMNTQARIFMPENALPTTVQRARRLGAEVHITPDIASAIKAVEGSVDEGRTALHPFDSQAVIAGNATIAQEIYEEDPAVTDIVVSVGGGGLFAGIATFAESVSWPVRLHAVEIEGAATLASSLDSDALVRITPNSISPALNSPYVSERAFELARRHLSTMTVTSASRTVDACFRLLNDEKILAEPAAGCTLAGLEELSETLPANSRAVLVLCGGNISLDDLLHLRLQHSES